MENSKKLVGERFLLVDEPLSVEKRQQIQGLEWVDGQPIQFIEDVELSRELDVILGNELNGMKNTLLVFPGNGACYPRQQLASIAGFPSCEVYAERRWVPGTDPIISAGVILPELFISTDVKKIIVVDDVISSGGTMLALHRVNAWKFPAAEWVAVAWVTQKLRSRPASGLRGFARTLRGCEVRKENGLKAAVNSLSTLRAKSELAQSYASRHLAVGSQKEFLWCLL